MVKKELLFVHILYNHLILHYEYRVNAIWQIKFPLFSSVHQQQIATIRTITALQANFQQ